MNTTTVANYLRDNVDWSRFYALVQTIGNTLNAPKYRFLKSDLIEQSLAVYSKNNRVIYVNRQGVDHELPELNTTLEMKYSAKALHSPKGVLKKTVSPVTLVNTLGDYVASKLPDDYAEYLLIADTRGVVVAHRSVLEKHLHFPKGQIVARGMPLSVCELVTSNVSFNVTKKINLCEEFESWKSEVISNVCA